MSRASATLGRHRSTLLIAGGLLLTVLVAVIFTASTRTDAGMDPDNPDPGGTQALARVLAAEGVQVQVARTTGALERVAVDAQTTVVVVSPHYLGKSTVERLLGHSATAGSLVLIGAGPESAAAFGVRGNVGSASLDDGLAAGCGERRFDGLTLQVTSAWLYPGGECFRDRLGGVVATTRPSPNSGSPSVDGAGDVLLFGAAHALTNDQIMRGDNAAIALRLLGQHPRLIWYVPRLEDLGAGESVAPSALLPRWLSPALGLLTVAMIAVIAWRGRRLGPLAVEPLPVVVRAVETTHGLGRLYRRSGDRGHAAWSLRRAARSRLAERLRLGSVPPDVLVRAVAARTGRGVEEVAALLDPAAPPPVSDRDLITVARELSELDREVRRQ